MTECPDIKNAAAGPEAPGRIIERDRRWCRRPTRAAIRWSSRAATGVSGRGRRRQRLPRLRRRHRRQLHRPLASRRGDGDHRAGAAVPAHVGHRLLLRAAGAAGRGAGGDRADRRRRAIVLRQLRHRGDRGVPQAGALRDRPPRTSSRSSAGFTAARMGSLSLTASKAVQRRGFGPLMPGVYHAPYRRLLSVPGRHVTPESCAAECLDFIEHQLFVQLVSPDEVAAIVVEPIQGEGGYVVAPDQFLQRLRELTDASTASCSSSTKCSRAWGGPGRCSRSSTPASSRTWWRSRRGSRRACRSASRVARAELMAWPPGAHASTFGGNPVSCAAALATITLLKEQLVAQRRRRRRAPDGGSEGAGGQASADRRRARPRADDRRRAGARSADEGARHRPSATPSSTRRSGAGCWCSARGRTRSASRRRWC